MFGGWILLSLRVIKLRLVLTSYHHMTPRPTETTPNPVTTCSNFHKTFVSNIFRKNVKKCQKMSKKSLCYLMLPPFLTFFVNFRTFGGYPLKWSKMVKNGQKWQKRPFLGFSRTKSQTEPKCGKKPQKWPFSGSAFSRLSRCPAS
jgi:hypothetical protein